MCLSGFVRSYARVGERQWQGCSARYEHSQPDRRGLGVRVSHVKTQTGSVCNESEDRDATLHHPAASGKAQLQKLINLLRVGRFTHEASRLFVGRNKQSGDVALLILVRARQETELICSVLILNCGQVTAQAESFTCV